MVEKKRAKRTPRAKPVPKQAERMSALTKEITTSWLTEPLDPETFMYLWGVYGAAAERKIPTKPGRFVPPDKPGPWLIPTDIPVNRGVFAMLDEMRDLKVTDVQKKAYMWRILDVPSIFDHADRLSKFIKRVPEGAKEGPGWLVNDAIIKAVALVRYNTEGERSEFDLDDLVRHADRFAEEDPD